jgi:hypothetical protein
MRYLKYRAYDVTSSSTLFSMDKATSSTQLELDGTV